MHRAVLLAFALVALGAAPTPVSADSIVTRELKQARGRTYVLFVPPAIKPNEKLPLLITLHGSGRGGRSLVEPWESLAKRERIIVAGPNALNSETWRIPADGPDLLYFLVDEIAAQYPVDRRRVYLFGHSGGAIFALSNAVIESEYFAAVAIHAGVLDRGMGDEVLKSAKRRIPLAIFIGDRDPLFPLDIVRNTRDRLVAAGFPVTFNEISFHNHSYYARARQINHDAWQFLSAYQLATDPKYTVYDYR